MADRGLRAGPLAGRHRATGGPGDRERGDGQRGDRGRPVRRHTQRGGGVVMWAVLAAVADQEPEDVGKAGPLGLLLTVVLLIAVAFLVKSMGKHLKRVPRSFDPEDEIRVPDDPAELFEPGPAGHRATPAERLPQTGPAAAGDGLIGLRRSAPVTRRAPRR